MALVSTGGRRGQDHASMPIADVPLEVRAGRALRSSASRRARLDRRRRAARWTRALTAAAACALIAVPAAQDAWSPLAPAQRAAIRCPVPTVLRNDFEAAAQLTDLPLGLLAGVALVESQFTADAESSAGAVGVMQLMPATADALHVDALDPAANVLGGAVYLRQLLTRYDGDVALALAAYNAGPTAVDRAGGAPSEETRTYVGDVEQTWHSYGSCT
jgi:soluble lytic murein transglycosylase-like protein